MDKLLLRPMEAAETLGVSRSRIYEMLADGTVPGVVRIGASIRVSRSALIRWVAEKAGESGKTQPAA